MTIDRFKVMHWMNVRKLTPAQVCTLGGLRAETLATILDGRRSYLGSDDMARLGRVLRISPEQVAFREGAGLAAVVQSAAGLHATRRAIQRAGIFHRQRAQHDGVHQGEDCRVGANAER